MLERGEKSSFEGDYFTVDAECERNDLSYTSNLVPVCNTRFGEIFTKISETSKNILSSNALFSKCNSWLQQFVTKKMLIKQKNYLL